MTILVIPYLGCNLKCKYCFGHGYRWVPNPKMNYNLQAILDSMERLHKQTGGDGLCMHGGECTLIPRHDFEVILKKMYQLQNRSAIQTNGYTIDNDMIRLFKKYKTSPGISIDGPSELNSLRGFPDHPKKSREYTKKVLRTMFKMRKQGVYVGIITLLHKVNAGSPSKLKKLLKFLLMLRNYNIKGGRLNFMWSNFPEAKQYELSPEQASEAWLYLYKHLKPHKDLRWQPFREFTDNLLGYSHSSCTYGKCDYFCTSGAKVILPDGSLGNCDRTHQEGYTYTRATEKPTYERYEVLKETDCDGCRFYHVCYDDQTEVLTRGGFKYFRDVSFQDEIATLNSRTDMLEYHKPLDKQILDYKGELIHWKGKQYDLKVTPDHQVYCATSNGHQPFKLYRAENVFHKGIAFKKDCKWIGEEPSNFKLPSVQKEGGWGKNSLILKNSFSISDYLQFMGWYLSEGYCRERKSGNYEIYVSQQHSDKRREIAELLRRMGYSPLFTIDDVYFNSKQWYKYLKWFGKAKEKFIPENIKNLSPKLLKIFFDAYMKGDGNGRTIFTSSPQMADDLQEIIQKIGWSSSVGIDKRRGVYHISVNQKKLTPVVCKKPTKEPYKGKVYDLTVPNHIMLVRRNGKVLWSGNCYGGCPATGEDGDWRNKTRWCKAIYDLYSAIERDLKAMFPNIILVPDHPEVDYFDLLQKGKHLIPFRKMLWTETSRPSSWKNVQLPQKQTSFEERGDRRNIPHGDSPHGDSWRHGDT